ncbi:ferric reductase-like transmembrane domain-containing protein [Crenobacter sp. SG2305]|uniref:ferredoxin reductase family protein n=1 Tax=Crenobacter oryzisoli TaxID=3056844 RepID=UPI0025AADA66|nr:ferric reductase-like transmembrane domain-containing protein [Crenobacter sp. SG2305]MDN0081823.1 ferric reductase-like transmembrane domain-containing protein [Crenobacter sp. SG2305]
MKKLLVGLLAGLAVVWSLTLIGVDPTASAWSVRNALMLFTGYASFLLMSLSMLLATRPTWLERPADGLDRLYQLHRYGSYTAVVLALLHWGLKLSSGLMRSLFGAPVRDHNWVLAPGSFQTLAHTLPVKSMGEWAAWALIVVLALTLLRKLVPYHLWRQLHRAMPVIYLIAVVHAVALAPAAYWLQPAGLLLGLAALIGSWGALVSLSGRIGYSRRFTGKVSRVVRNGDILEVQLSVPSWRGHRSGQFAFFTVDRREGAHPFTLASADRGDGLLTFQIKALGDFTRRLGAQLQVGQRIEVEGPYGRFVNGRIDASRPQLWIAGGVGVTPFLAWLEALQQSEQPVPEVTLCYCVRNRRDAVFADRLRALCAPLPSIRLVIHASAETGPLDVATLGNFKAADGKGPEVWCCGPQGLASHVRQSLANLGLPPVQFHQEAFAMR